MRETHHFLKNLNKMQVNQFQGHIFDDTPQDQNNDMLTVVLMSTKCLQLMITPAIGKLASAIESKANPQVFLVLPL